MRYDLIIFDMDGTILDTLKDLACSVNYALKNNNLKERREEEVKTFVGNGIHKLIERSVPSGTEKELVEKVYKDFCEYYEKHCYDYTNPYSGILELINKINLSGAKCAVVSNKSDFAVKILADKYFSKMFCATQGVTEKIKIKPNPDSVLKIIKDMNVNKNRCLYVGDSEVDILTAKNAGIDCISVSWGFKTVEFLIENDAKIVVNNTQELYQLIK